MAGKELEKHYLLVFSCVVDVLLQFLITSLSSLIIFIIIIARN